jgi:hypothetical protein
VVFIPRSEAAGAHVEISRRIKRRSKLSPRRCPFLVTLGALAPQVCEIMATPPVYSEEL